MILRALNHQALAFDIAAAINSEGSAVASRYCDTFKSGSVQQSASAFAEGRHLWCDMRGDTALRLYRIAKHLQSLQVALQPLTGSGPLVGCIFLYGLAFKLTFQQHHLPLVMDLETSRLPVDPTIPECLEPYAYVPVSSCEDVGDALKHCVEAKYVTTR